MIAAGAFATRSKRVQSTSRLWRWRFGESQVQSQQSRKILLNLVDQDQGLARKTTNCLPQSLIPPRAFSLSFARCNRTVGGDFVIDVEIIDRDGTGTPREGLLDLRQGRQASAA
jgi:hypothetical protein